MKPKVTVTTTQPWTVVKPKAVPKQAAPVKKTVSKKTKAKLNTAAKKAFFPQSKYTVPKYPNA